MKAYDDGSKVEISPDVVLYIHSNTLLNHGNGGEASRALNADRNNRSSKEELDNILEHFLSFFLFAMGGLLAETRQLPLRQRLHYLPPSKKCLKDLMV